MSRSLTYLVLAALLIASGCGSDDDSDSGGSKPAASGPAASGPAPAGLVGTYTTTLTKQDIASNGSPELDVSPEWELTIANSGGPGGGHAFSLKNKAEGELETSDFGVSGDTIVLKGEECAAGGTTKVYDNEYRFTQSGGTLRFTKIKNSCSDRVAETVITSQPWKKQGG